MTREALTLEPVPEWMNDYQQQPAELPHDLKLLAIRKPTHPWPELPNLRGDLTEWDYSAEVLRRREDSTRVRLNVHIDIEVPLRQPRFDLLFDLVELFYHGDPLVDHNVGAHLWTCIKEEWLD